MQKMYVANTTHQVQVFAFRLPESKQQRQQTIDVGNQTTISGMLTPTDIGAIVQQHAKYGFVSVDEAKRNRGYAGLIYSLDKPVPEEIIKMMVDRNVGALQDRGREQRQNAAIGMTNSVLGREMREKGYEAELEEVEVEMTEDNDAPAKGRRAQTGDDRLEENVVVTRADVQGNENRGRNRRGRRG